MSTIVVAKKNGTVSIGADSLFSYGSTAQQRKYLENSSKLVRAGDNIFAFVGHASWGLILDDILSSYSDLPTFSSAHEVFSFSKHLHKTLKEDFFLNPKDDDDDPFESTHLECLIASPYGIFGLCSMRSVEHFSRFSSYGSGYQYALGAMHSQFETSFSSEEVAQAGLAASADFDEASSAPFDIESISLR